MKLLIDIPESIYDTIQADEMISREQLAVLQMHILNGIPHETVTEFADRRRECGRERVLDKIIDEVCDIEDKIVLNPDSLFERKAYVRFNKVVDIIDKYRGR